VIENINRVREKQDADRAHNDAHGPQQHSCQFHAVASPAIEMENNSGLGLVPERAMN
jgi:hypothetical protein